MPAFGYLGPRDTEAESETPAGQGVERGRRHGGVRRGTTGNLEHRGADIDVLGLGRHPGEHGCGIGSVCLGGPRHRVSESVGLAG